MKFRDYLILGGFLAGSLFLCGKESKTSTLEENIKDSTLFIPKNINSGNLPFDEYDMKVLGGDYTFDIREEYHWLTDTSFCVEEGDTLGLWGMFNLDGDNRDETFAFFFRSSKTKKFSLKATYILEDRTGKGYDFALVDGNGDDIIDYKEAFNTYMKKKMEQNNQK